MKLSFLFLSLLLVGCAASDPTGPAPVAVAPPVVAPPVPAPAPAAPTFSFRLIGVGVDCSLPNLVAPYPFFTLADTTFSSAAFSYSIGAYLKATDGHFVAGLPITWSSTNLSVWNPAYLNRTGSVGTAYMVATVNYEGVSYSDSTSMRLVVVNKMEDCK